MAKNIILLSDGTGNSASNLFKSNVWRLYQALDLTSEDPDDKGQPKQLAYHDDGVGTSSFKPWALLGGAFGWGLKRNVLDLYCFLSRHYQPDRNDRIYAFGFSRGAFTIRVLTDLVLKQGLAQTISDESGQKRPVTETERKRLAELAYRAYRNEHYSGGWLAIIFRMPNNAWHWFIDKLFRRKPYNQADYQTVKEIEFLGLWDTVAAYGLPFDELTRAWNFIFPLSFPDRNLDKRVKRACHALALDDERLSFHPELWNEKDEKKVWRLEENKQSKEDELTIEGNLQGPANISQERITQVWFAGMHSNVGGSYPDDGMSLVPFCWILEQASPPTEEPEKKDDGLCFIKESKKKSKGLWIDEVERRKIKAAANPNGKMYDSRKGMGGFYRYRPRKLRELTQDEREPKNSVVIELPKIHESVFRRIKNGTDGYAPIGLPDNYAVVEDNGTVMLLPETATAGNSKAIETKTEAITRARQQEQIWSRVWLKRQVYFLSIVLVGALASLRYWRPQWQILNLLDQVTTYMEVPTIIGALGKLLPEMASPWITSFQKQPGLFSVLALLYVAVLRAGHSLQRHIFDAMLIKWNSAFPKFGKPVLTGKEPRGLLHRLYHIRMTEPVQRFMFWWKQRLIPYVILLVLLGGAYYVVHRSFYLFWNSAGSICRPSLPDKPMAELQNGIFPSNTPCWSTGINAEKGKRYRISIELKENNIWRDDGIPTGLAGFSVDEEKVPSYLLRWVMRFAQPLRRQPDGKWFQPIIKIGSRGRDEYILNTTSETNPDKFLTTTIEARQSGELFLFVNDFVLPLPCYQPAYINNHGTANVTVTQLPDCPKEEQDCESQVKPSPPSASEKVNPAAD